MVVPKYVGDRRPEYNTWCNMLQRCRTSSPAYSLYGGRGISVCERWVNSFDDFVSDMGRRPAGASIERIDNNRGYEPSNCKWATKQEQANNRRSNRLIEHGGQTKTLAQWAAALGMQQQTLHARLNRSGWPTEHALTRPLRRD